MKSTLRLGCSPVILLHTLRTPFTKNTSERLLLRFIGWKFRSNINNNVASLIMPQSQNYNFGSRRPQIFEFFFQSSPEWRPFTSPSKKSKGAFAHAHNVKGFINFTTYTNLMFIWKRRKISFTLWIKLQYLPICVCVFIFIVCLHHISVYKAVQNSELIAHVPFLINSYLGLSSTLFYLFRYFAVILTKYREIRK